MYIFKYLFQDSEKVQRAAKQRRNSQPRTSPNSVVASTSSTSTHHLPPAATTASTSSTATAPVPAGLSMPSIASSTSVSPADSISNADYTSDTPGSSEFPVNEIDYYPLDSPPTISSTVMSPYERDAMLNEDGLADFESVSLTNRMFLTAKAKSQSATDAICYLTPSHKQRSCPLPNISWSDSIEMWNLMCRKDDLAWLSRKPNMFDEHPGLQPRMRAILLDWLNEVCEVYKLHRETYYLAVDYIDRYLSRQKDMKKSHLQLLGITALFIAAKVSFWPSPLSENPFIGCRRNRKSNLLRQSDTSLQVEEIYPPKIGEFAYVTDGACTEKDILCEELLLLAALEWRINPVTVMGWLGLYMQINVTSRKSHSLPVRNNECAVGKSSSRKRKITDENEDSSNIKKMKVVQQQQPPTTTTTTTTKTDDAFVYPQFSGMEFAHTAQLIDLCSLDVGLANFKYSVIAAAAISHTFDRKTATLVSGFCWEEIAPCAKWMEPFFQVICDENAACPLTFLESNEPIKYCHGLKHVCPDLVSDSSHIIQTHTTTLDMLDLVSIKIEEMESTAARMGLLEASPAPISIESEDGILTPPASNRKSLEAIGSVITAVQVVAPEAITNVRCFIPFHALLKGREHRSLLV
uniref:Uncharacterized protein n=1 Tax=Anopheles culicifacies TaxID=139723 RepID=A0A182M5W0_9DIPT